MKYHIYLLGLLAVLSAACSESKEDIRRTDLDHDEVFFATIENASTRVYTDENLHVLWNADDRVSIFNRITINQEYRFTGEDGDGNGTFTKVPGSNPGTGYSLDYVYSVYPYQESTIMSSYGALTVTLPEKQAYRENSFGRGANTMIAVSRDDELMFKNLCGYLVVRLYGANATITSIALKGNNNEPLAGVATVIAVLNGAPVVVLNSGMAKEIKLVFEDEVTLGTTSETPTSFWFAVPPTTFNNGITLVINDKQGYQYEKTTSKPLEIKRNILTPTAALDIDKMKFSPGQNEGTGDNYVEP